MMGPQLASFIPAAAAREEDDLCRLYTRHFTTVRADTEILKAQFYRLRYQVYCVENAFEDPSAQSGEMERDAFDAHSVSSLLIHRHTGIIAGGIRLILPSHRDAKRELPLLGLCDRHALDFHARELPRERTAEVSRNVISKQSRQLMAALSGSGVTTSHRLMRHLSLGLIAAVIRMAAEQRMTHMCAMMEAPALRMFARLGLHFHKLGTAVEHHGLRQPAYVDFDTLLARAWTERPDVWALITRNGLDWPLNQRLALSAAWPANRLTAH
jgi:N-acyl amino acid synthase of PEP-CTERM/exosortase system